MKELSTWRHLFIWYSLNIITAGNQQLKLFNSFRSIHNCHLPCKVQETHYNNFYLLAVMTSRADLVISVSKLQQEDSIIWAASGKTVFEQAQNAQIQIILRMRKISSRSLLPIHTFCSIHWFYQPTLTALIRPQGYKKCFMPNSSEHEIFSANKYENANKLAFSYLFAEKFSFSDKFSKKEFAIVSHLRFISKPNFILSWIEHESFITSRKLCRYAGWSGPLLSTYVWRQVFAWRGPFENSRILILKMLSKTVAEEILNLFYYFSEK